MDPILDKKNPSEKTSNFPNGEVCTSIGKGMPASGSAATGVEHVRSSLRGSRLMVAIEAAISKVATRNKAAAIALQRSQVPVNWNSLLAEVEFEILGLIGSNGVEGLFTPDKQLSKYRPTPVTANSQAASAGHLNHGRGGTDVSVIPRNKELPRSFHRNTTVH